MKAFWILIAFYIVAPLSVQATHIMGADITWKSLGNDSFEIIVHAYRDCNGIQLSGVDLGYQSTNDTCVSSRTTIIPHVCCGTDITPVCKNSCDRCNSSSCAFPYGIQEWTITATVYLPPPCCGYTISWEESSRSADITTCDAKDNGFYEEVFLNRCIKPGDNSPYFSAPPITIFCTNQCETFNSGAIDNDTDAFGRYDSLVYRFGQPQSAQGKNIIYNYPYTNDAPLIYTGNSKNQAFISPYCYGFHLDSFTGDISFKALRPDNTVIAILVDEYRKDSSGKMVKIGEIKRDIELMIMDCPHSNHPPIIPGINGGSAYSIKICANVQSCFQVKAFDLDLPDTDSIAWNKPPDMSGATFSVVPNGQKWPTAVFCWKPSISQIRTSPYRFVVNAIDNKCPIPGRISKEFTVIVASGAPIAKYSATVDKCGMVYFDAATASKSPSHIQTYQWSGAGAHGEAPLNINNKYGSYQYIKGGKYYYTLTVAGAEGCTATYTDSVIIPDFVGIDLPRDTAVCSGAQVSIKAIPVNTDTSYRIYWNTGSTNNIINPFITSDTQFIAHIRDSSGCLNYNTIRIKSYPYPKAITGPDRSICYGDTTTIGGSTVFQNVYLWLSDPAGYYNYNSKVVVKPLQTTLYRLKEFNPAGCSKTDSVLVTVNPLPDPTWFLNYSGNESWFHAVDSSLADTDYRWIFDDPNANGKGTDSAIGHSVSHLYARVNNYTVNLSIKNNLGCKNNYDSTVYIEYAGLDQAHTGMNSILVYPNPFNTDFQLEYSLSKSSKVRIILQDITGKEINTVQDKYMESGNYSIEINSGKYQLHPGIYILQFMTEDGSISRKLVKF